LKFIYLLNERPPTDLVICLIANGPGVDRAVLGRSYYPG